MDETIDIVASGGHDASGYAADITTHLNNVISDSSINRGIIRSLGDTVIIGGDPGLYQYKDNNGSVKNEVPIIGEM
jgi:hypothetical protein